MFKNKHTHFTSEFKGNELAIWPKKGWKSIENLGSMSSLNYFTFVVPKA